MRRNRYHALLVIINFLFLTFLLLVIRHVSYVAHEP